MTEHTPSPARPEPDALATAREWARLGRRVFPLKGRTKQPAISAWQEQATSDLAKIDRWAVEFRDANWGLLCCEGLCVLDIDGDPGIASYVAMKLGQDAINTFRVRTPRGFHMYYLGDLPTSAGRLGAGLDTRGSGRGYVVIPGSFLRDEAGAVAGVWRVYRNFDLAPIPQALLDAFPQPAAVRPIADRAVAATGLEEPNAIERAAQWLMAADPAVSGQGGNARAYQTAARVKDMGVSEQAALALMLSGRIGDDEPAEPAWNDRCAPPWDAEELAVIIGNAYRYGQNPPGSARPEHIFDRVFIEPPPAFPPATATPAPAGAAGTWDEPDLGLISDALAAAPPFPREVLGLALPWCEANARAANAPFDYGAAGLLTIAAALIGNAREAAFDSEWGEPSILWAALIGPPSSGKSPSLDPLQRLLAELEGEMARGFKDAHRAWEGECELAKSKRAKWEQRFKPTRFRHSGSFGTGREGEETRAEGGEGREGRAITTDEGQFPSSPLALSASAKAAKMPEGQNTAGNAVGPLAAANTAKMLEWGDADAIPFDDLALPAEAVIPDEPVRQRVTLGSVTVEEAAALSAGNPKGLLVLEDELAAWFRNFDRYAGGGGGGGGGDAAFWLKGYGARLHLADRRKLGKPIRVPRLAFCILGGLQPDIAAQLMARQEDGLSARFVFAYPDPVAGFRRAGKATDHAPMKRALRRLASLALDGPADARRPVPCPLTAPAADEFEAWWDVKKGRAQSEPGFMGHWLGKAGGLALRLALVLQHLWWSWDEPADDPLDPPPRGIGLDSVLAAVRLIEEWAEPMARRVVRSAAVSPGEGDAAALARWLQGQGTRVFNARDARRSPKGPGGRLNNAATMAAACDALTEAGLIRPSRPSTAKGRPASDFEVNPLLLSKGTRP